MEIKIPFDEDRFLYSKFGTFSLWYLDSQEKGKHKKFLKGSDDKFTVFLYHTLGKIGVLYLKIIKFIYRHTELEE